jgi:ribosomal protein S18 acetylase RimI-like enzyme
MGGMHPIIVRRATTADLESLLRFEQGVVNAERPFDCTLREGPIQYYDLSQILNSENAHFVVAESGPQIVGCGFARIQSAKPYLKHRLQAYLGLMYVDLAYRGDAINGKIIDSLKQWCRSRNIDEMRLEVYHDNLAAVRAYEKAGFSKLMVEMRMRSSDG